MRFYLGFHHPHQLAHAGVPLFVSHRRLDVAEERAEEVRGVLARTRRADDG